MKTKLLLAIIVCSCLSSPLYAMGSKKPATKTPVAAASIIPTLDFGPELLTNDYLESSAQVGPQVDDYKGDDELAGKAREVINPDTVDKCFDDKSSHDYFINQISYYTAEMLNDVPAKVGMVGGSYGTSTDDDNYFPTSLIRHPLCESTADNLRSTIKKIPKQSTIDKLNRFAAVVNELRQNVLNGDMESKKDLLSTWTRFFSCLGYSESLSTSDSKVSVNVAAKVAPSGYRKPAGVEFYEDQDQPEVSMLNIGMYQFTPNSGGNVQPCIRAWNALHANKATCQVNPKANQTELIKVFGSSLQSFNAFCGVHKLIQTFAIQVNTSKKSATHPANFVGGKLKPYEERCVTPYFYSGWAYNHFGPFQNSTGSNMDEMFSCIENSH